MFADHLDRLDEAVMTHLGDGTCTYRGTGQGSGFVAEGIAYILDRDFEAQNDDQVAFRVTTVSVLVSDVPSSTQGDQIETPARTWQVQQILEDDGSWRRLYVT